MRIEEVAKALGVSIFEVGKFRTLERLSFDTRRYSDALCQQVVVAYNQGGEPLVSKLFPKVYLRSILSRTPHPARQRPWSQQEIIKAATMAGIVPLEVQVAIFNRPRGSVRGIRHLHTGHLAGAFATLHGLRPTQARALCRPGYPTVDGSIRLVKKPEPPRKRYRDKVPLLLWCEAGPWLQDWVPDYLREAIDALADFQRWLLQTDDPAAEFRRMSAMGHATA